MHIGLAKVDITPRVGAELCGFGPFLHRYSIGVRDRLWARAMAIEDGTQRLLLVSCDLIGTALSITRRVRELVTAATGIPGDAIMICSSHTHSGPCTGPYIGWGEADLPYLELLPQRIADACLGALGALRPATLSHAEVPCEGIGVNREYDRDAPPLEEVLVDGWRPAKPELTDTTCHVVKIEADGQLIGFVSYFGCHPVVCCQQTRYIHGDYAGVATNLLEREHPGSIGLFLQGAQGDVNTCVVHKPETESLLALDIIAGRYANAVRRGLAQARPIGIDVLGYQRSEVAFTRKPWGIDKLRTLLAEHETRMRQLQAEGRTDRDDEVRMTTVHLTAMRRLVAKAEAGESLSPPIELHGFRLGPLTLVGSPFEVFQAIKNDVRARAQSPVFLLMGLTNDSVGYAPDHTAAARGGYAADFVPIMCGALPFANIHDELTQAFLEVEAALYGVKSVA